MRAQRLHAVPRHDAPAAFRDTAHDAGLRARLTRFSPPTSPSPRLLVRSQVMSQVDATVHQLREAIVGVMGVESRARISVVTSSLVELGFFHLKAMLEKPLDKEQLVRTIESRATKDSVTGMDGETWATTLQAFTGIKFKPVVKHAVSTESNAVRGMCGAPALSRSYSTLPPTSTGARMPLPPPQQRVEVRVPGEAAHYVGPASRGHQPAGVGDLPGQHVRGDQVQGEAAAASAQAV